MSRGIFVLFNPGSGTADAADRVKEALADVRHVTFAKPGPEEKLGDLVQRAVAEDAKVLAIAGGDGTVHAAVNALGPEFPHIRLAILPLGTGNDLCRTLAIPLDPVEAAQLVKRGRVRRLDAIRVDGDWSGWLANAATGGFAGQVAKDVTSELKADWGPLAYLRGASGTIADPPKFQVSLTIDGRPPISVEVINVVIANGRTAAGGFAVAPTADPEDGKLDLVLVTPASILDRAVITARLLAGEYLADDNVRHFRARTVELTADSPMPFSMDGETAEGKSFRFSVVPGALKATVGRGYRHNPRRGWLANSALADAARRLFSTTAAAMVYARNHPAEAAVGAGFVLLAVVAATALALAVGAGRTNDFNVAVVADVQSAGSPAVDLVARGITNTAGPVARAILGIALVAAILRRVRPRIAIFLLVAFVGSVVLEGTVKAACAVVRPTTAVPGPWPWGYSFPSGHSIFAASVGFAAAGLAALRNRWALAAALLAWVVGVGVSRVYLGAHWPTDVLGAWLIAAAWAGFMLMVKRAGMRNRK